MMSRRASLFRHVLAVLTLLAGAQIAPAAGPPGSPPELATLMAQLALRKHGHISYVEEHFIGVLDRPLKSSGELLYDAPGRLEKRTLLPRPETVVLENGLMTARRGRRTYVVNLADYPQVVPLIDSIRAMLAGDLPTLERLFTVEWQGDGPQWRLQLAPRDAAMTRTVKQIEVRGAGDHIQSVEIRQADGDRSVLTLGAEISG
jgi:hypothetical protein